jgi:hypothetical protein
MGFVGQAGCWDDAGLVVFCALWAWRFWGVESASVIETRVGALMLVMTAKSWHETLRKPSKKHLGNFTVNESVMVFYF